MQRRDALKGIAAGIAAAATAASPATAASGAEGDAHMLRPNVLFVHCHDLGRYLHCYGWIPCSRESGPLAGEGVLLNACSARAAVAARRGASLFKGRYPHTTA